MTTDQIIQSTFRFRGRTRNFPWCPQRGRREDVSIMFSKLGFTKGVEVGVYRGQFSRYLCDTNPQLQLYCVDPWTVYSKWSQEREDIWHAEAVERLKDCNATIVRKKSLDAVNDFEDGYFDFVWIGGDHTFDMAIQDIIKWTPKVRKEGIFLVHDYWVNGVGCDVMQAVNAYTHSHGINPWYLTREFVAPSAYWVIK